MFYARFILSKKGALGKVWLAAHLERKLSRELVFETKVEEAIELIKTPTIKISLRTNGHLLLGIVRIYAKKAYFVLHDLDAAWRAFRHTDFSDRRIRHPHRRRTRVAGVVSIAPAGDAIAEEEEEEFDEELPNMRDFNHPLGPEFRAFADPEQITLQEHDGLANPTLSFLEDGIEPEAYETLDIDNAIEAAVDQFRRSESVNRSDGLEPMETNGLPPFNTTFDQVARASLNNVSVNQLNIPTRDLSLAQDPVALQISQLNFDESMDVPPEVLAGFEPEAETRPPPQDSGIHLDPLSESQIRQEIEADRRPRRRRPRNLIVDDEICLDDAEIREWIRHDLENRIEMAPPTRSAMVAKEKGSLLNIFNNPATNLFINPEFMRMYQDRCVPNLRSDNREQPTAEDVRESLGLMVDHPEEMDDFRTSRPQSIANSILADRNVSEVLADLEEQPRRESTVSNLMELQAPSFVEIEDYEMDVENQDPCAPPPFKRPRSTPDTTKSFTLSHEVETAKKTLLTRLKENSEKSRTSTVDFHSTIMPGINNLSAVSVLTRKKLGFKAASSFYALLELQKDRAVDLSQPEPFGPISVTIKS